jgi:outer membrane protein assembly factor BamB
MNQNAPIRWPYLPALLSIVMLAAPRRAAASPNWPQFRGPNGSGVGDPAKPPIAIGPTNSVQWQMAVPWSPSSPCVWDDRIFLTAFVDAELQTRAYSRRNGQLLWSKGIKPEALEVYHKTENSPASATPATDGRHVVSYFGSFGLVCYDPDGKELWRHPLPVAVSGGNFGSGTSPIITQNLVLLNRDQDTTSSLLAIHIENGQIAWETPRPDTTGSFGTPIIWRNQGAEQVVVPGCLRLKGYDLKTGKENWQVRGAPAFACTSPVLGDGWLYFAAWSPGKSDAPWPSWETFLARFDQNKDGAISFDEFPESDRDFMRGLDVDHDGRITKSDFDAVMARQAKGENTMLAIKPGGQGDITTTHVAWKFDKGLPYVSSPLFYEGRVYLIKDGGMLSSFDAKTGKPYYLQERLEAAGSYYSSPVAADGRLYLASLAGKLTVVKAGEEKPEILHQADFGDRIFATPALVGDHIYLRTQNRLYAFAKDARPGK